MKSFFQQERRGLETLLLFAALLAVKVLGLLIDPTIRLYFGDSSSYLQTALTGWIPTDRSFLYGYFIAATALTAHSMHALSLAQSALGAITACLLFRILRDSFDTSRALVAGLALAVALEPAQLFYERMVMAESIGTTMLAIMLYAGFAWLRRPHWAWPVLWALAGILAVAMRMSHLPVVLGFALLPVLVGIATLPGERKARRFLPHLAVALVSTLVLHSGYKHLYGRLSHSRPDYIIDSGAFRLGLVAPLVKREHVARAGLPPELLDSVGPSLHDPRMREAQIWVGDGLIARVRAASHGDARVARKLAAYAIRSDPLGLVRLAWATLGDYFDRGVARARMEDDLGNRPADEVLAARLRACCGYDVHGFESRRNLIARYFAASAPWLTMCYFGLLPLSLLTLALQWRRARAAALLLAATSAGIVLSTALFSHIVSFRYLHPLSFVALLCFGALLSAIMNRDRGSQPDAPDTPTAASRADPA